ncbi:MAG TPA: FHA domain-containing protein [Pyrinomonadaceae bacterium]|nr:FHA domain-containing protein [Pyrinomonadaceae bacterium]
MIKCQSCGTDNLDGSLYCDECGTSLGARNNGPSSFASPGYQPPISEPSFQAASVTSIGIEPLIEQVEPTPANPSDPRQTDGVHATLTIERGTAVGKEFQLTGEESYIGRWDADNGIFPDVDLDAFDPEAKISRRHARIVFRNATYVIEDLGSTNGTYVNRGRRLIPGSPHVLRSGDEIIVGKTFLRFAAA